MTVHASSLKLASLYLAILMSISLIFSITIYSISARELDRGIKRPAVSIINGPELELSQQLRNRFIQERIEAYEFAKDQIVAKLVLINIAILVAGGLLSYYLALRTLKPIEDAHAAQSRFAANASHELRTPITAMRSENEVALMDPNLTLKSARVQLQSNLEELEKLTNLSESLLRLAQLEEASVTYEPVNIADIIADGVTRLKQSAKLQKVLIDLPEKIQGQTHGDRAGLTEAFVTILDNAIKYTPIGGTVHISCHLREGNHDIAIVDNGPGIPNEQIPYIFDRFYRADNARSKQSHNGFGLGLAIAKGIIDAHNGAIFVASNEKGSTFTLSLPDLSS